MFGYLNILEGTADETEPIGQYQKFTLFLNMGLEMSCLFLFKSSEKLFARPKKLF